MRAVLVLTSAFHLALIASILPIATALNCYFCDDENIACDATHAGNLTVKEQSMSRTLMFTDRT